MGCASLLLLTAAAPAAAAATGGPAAWKGRWSTPPQYTPTCVPGGILPGTEQDPTRTFACSEKDPFPPRFKHPPAPKAALPKYVDLSHARRDFHHMPDGPLAGNGNVGVVVGVAHDGQWSHYLIVTTSIGTCSITALVVYIFEYVAMKVGT
jgi:hypothetical protein